MLTKKIKAKSRKEEKGKEPENQTPAKKGLVTKIKNLIFVVVKFSKYTSWIALGIIIISGYLIFSGNKAQDFNIKTTKSADLSFQNKILNIKHTPELEISQEEITSFLNLSAKNKNLSDFQVKFIKNKFIGSFLLNNALASSNIGITFSGSITPDNHKKPQVIIYSLTLGRLPLPFSFFKEKLASIINSSLEKFQADHKISLEFSKIAIVKEKIIFQR